MLKRGAAREICVFKAPSTGQAADLRVTVVGPDGVEQAQTPAGVKVVRDADGFDRIVFTIEPNGAAGVYAIKVSLGGATSETSSFRVQ